MKHAEVRRVDPVRKAVHEQRIAAIESRIHELHIISTGALAFLLLEVITNSLSASPLLLLFAVISFAVPLFLIYYNQLHSLQRERDALRRLELGFSEIVDPASPSRDNLSTWGVPAMAGFFGCLCCLFALAPDWRVDQADTMPSFVELVRAVQAIDDSLTRGPNVACDCSGSTGGSTPVDLSDIEFSLAGLARSTNAIDKNLRDRLSVSCECGSASGGWTLVTEVVRSLPTIVNAGSQIAESVATAGPGTWTALAEGAINGLSSGAIQAFFSSDRPINVEVAPQTVKVIWPKDRLPLEFRPNLHVNPTIAFEPDLHLTPDVDVSPVVNASVEVINQAKISQLLTQLVAVQEALLISAKPTIQECGALPTPPPSGRRSQTNCR